MLDRVSGTRFPLYINSNYLLKSLNWSLSLFWKVNIHSWAVFLLVKSEEAEYLIMNCFEAQDLNRLYELILYFPYEDWHSFYIMSNMWGQDTFFFFQWIINTSINGLKEFFFSLVFSMSCFFPIWYIFLHLIFKVSHLA